MADSADFLPLLLLWASGVSYYLLSWFGYPSLPSYSNAAQRGRMMLEVPQQPHHHQPSRSSRGSHEPHMHALVEMAYICDPQNTTQTDRARAFVAGAFGAADPPAWHLFPAIHGPPGGCPTVAFTDKHAWPAKGIGTTLAHTLVWREFVRRHLHRHGYLVVFENDVVCAVDNCGAAIKKALAQAKSAFVFLGWCSMLADADPRTTQTPPWCLHGYALTAHAARCSRLLGLADAPPLTFFLHRELLGKVYDCEAPLDTQVRQLLGQRAVTWEAVDLKSLNLQPNARAWPADNYSHTQGILVQETL